MRIIYLPILLLHLKYYRIKTGFKIPLATVYPLYGFHLPYCVSCLLPVANVFAAGGTGDQQMYLAF